MNTALLSEDDVVLVHNIMARHGIERFDASIRFWGRGKSIEVTGDLGERQLHCLIEIMRRLSELDSTDSSTGPIPLFARAA